MSADRDGADQLTDALRRVLVAQLDRPAEGLGQLFDLLFEAGKGLGMKRHDIQRLGRAGQLVEDVALFLHQLLRAPVEAFDVADALHQPIGDPIGLAPDRRKAALQLGALRDRVGREPLALGVILACIFGEQRRMAKL